MTRDQRYLEVAERAARAVEEVPGVAFLSPGLAGLVRNATHLLVGSDGRPARPHGVRVTRRDGPDGWHVEVQVAVRRGNRALDVARAVRAAVRAAVPHPTPATVRVTVTHLV
ncbi:MULTISPECIES: Asp23/Gls24 family envelope stress response protein [Streptomyces]|uniref:Asp23/Gls24 family envelope stress response protein n=1 Tax=Streptomyces TaxID=1883 RepID=UPI000CD4D02C|nr:MULTISPECIES: Asp23/Gls24 family envelope stress response protein [Streptomyces]